jgi:hypothetical protein
LGVSGMAVMSKSRDKKRLLLDEEELMPRADAWDIFYGKKPTPGVKPPEFPLPAGEPDQSITASPLPAIPYTDESELREDSTSTPPTTAEKPIEMPVRPVPDPATIEIDERQPTKRTRAAAPIAFRARRIERVDEDRKQVPDKVSDENAPALAPRREEYPTGGITFENWVKRWAPMLKRGASLRVCQVFFQLTHGSGREDCFTSNTAVMKLSGLSRAQCIRNIHHLLEIGFLDEIGESNNKDAKGTHYRFNLIPRQFST